MSQASDVEMETTQVPANPSPINPSPAYLLIDNNGNALDEHG